MKQNFPMFDVENLIAVMRSQANVNPGINPVPDFNNVA
jgi:hypothetical protein